MSVKMPMEAACCEYAMKVAVKEALKPLIATLAPLIAGLEPELRKKFIKELVKLGPEYADLVDLL